MLDFIDLPDYFDRDKFFNAFQTLETKALYAYFRCNNSTTFANLMRKYFPDRPLGMSTAEYVCGLIEDERNFNKELGIEPKLQQAEESKPLLVNDPSMQMPVKTTAKSFMSMKEVAQQEVIHEPKIDKIDIEKALSEWENIQDMAKYGKMSIDEAVDKFIMDRLIKVDPRPYIKE